MKNNILNNSWYKQLHRFNITNSLIIFFLSMFATYEIHYWTKGIILSSRFFSFISFSTLVVIFSIKIWPWMKGNAAYNRDTRDWIWIIVSLLAVYLILSFWIGVNHVPGDYGRNKQFALQLLNGSVQSHPFYKEALGFYPPLSHTTIAVFTNLFGLYVQHSFMVISVLISFLIPLLSYKMARKLGFSPVLSLFFASLISLYGGVGEPESRMFHLYLPAIQMYLPYISRNISILLFLSVLFLCFNFTRQQQLSYNNSINIGVLIGLLGLTQPHGFLSAQLFLLTYYVINFKTRCLQKEILRHLLISVLIGGILASIHYVPFIIKMTHVGGLLKSEQLIEVFPTKFFMLYGPLPFLGLYALCNINKDSRSWMLSSVLFVISLIGIRFILGYMIPIDKWIIFWIHRHSAYIFIFLSLLATAGFDNLIRLMNKMRFVAVLLMILIIYTGYSTSFEYLYDEWRTPFSIRKVIKTGNVFPERGIEKLRFLVPDPQDVLIVPPVPQDLARTIANETGLNISYNEWQRVKFKQTITQEERFEMVDRFYKDLESGILRKAVLSFFKTNIFLSHYNDLDERHDLLEKITSLKNGDNIYFLYKLNK